MGEALCREAKKRKIKRHCRTAKNSPKKRRKPYIYVALREFGGYGNMLAKTTTRFFAATTLTLILLGFASPKRLLAHRIDQTPTTSSFPGGDLDNRQLAMDHAGDQNKKLSPRDTKLVLANINEDFQRIQVVNKKLVQANAGNASLDYKNLSQMAAELSKRASRLKINLLLPRTKKTEKTDKNANALSADQLKAKITELNKALIRFVTNPLFQRDAGVVDPELSMKANRDLGKVITLSDSLRESAEKLRKSSEK